MLSQCLTEYAESGYKERAPFLKGIGAALDQGFAGCSREEAVLMRFFYGTMPLRDAGEYDFAVFLSFVRHALWLRKHMEWCSRLPEDIFVNHVLYYRINSEGISENRAFFYEQLKDRIAGKNCEEAVLEVNYWCAEHVTYQATDQRTASPMALFQGGRGRCGEESVFTVTALRSIGIPARQVYTPVWAHCDDNHAWVEVWLEGAWHFLGACEPEEVLDRGWFAGAAGRAMLIHSRSFSDFMPEDREERVGSDGAVHFFNLTAAYARTGRLTVAVRDGAGKPVCQAAVVFEILNMAEYVKAAELFSDEKGEVSVTLGLGDIHVRAGHAGGLSEAWISVTKSCSLTMILDRGKMACGDSREQREVRAPLPCQVRQGSVTREQRSRKAQKTALAQQKRQERISSFYRSEAAVGFPEEKELLRMAGGNFDELFAFLTRDQNPQRKLLLHTLSAKDLRDAEGSVLEDALGREKGDWPEELWKTCILCPRIQDEELTPYHHVIDSWFTEQEKMDFRRNPENIRKYIEENIGYRPKLDYKTIYATPVGCLRLKQGNPMSQEILFAAVCRTLGIPAGIDRITQRRQYKKELMRSGEDGGKLAAVALFAEDGGKQAALVLFAEDGRKWIYHQTWTISRFTGAHFQTLNFDGCRFAENSLALLLSEGIYRLLTAMRLPNGNQHLWEYTFHIKEGEEKKIFMAYREAAL